MLVMTWLVIAELALIGFLVVGWNVLVITYARKRRRGGRPPLPDPNASGYLDLIRGIAPPTPLPEWAQWPDAPDDDSGGNDVGGRLSRREHLCSSAGGARLVVLSAPGRAGSGISAWREFDYSIIA